jgi:Phage integrase family
MFFNSLAEMVVSQFGTCQKAGLQKFRFHDLRHTFDSLLIQAGVSSAYVQKQMGHRSIQVTIDVYGHLIPGENVAWIDTLDGVSKKVTATDAHQTHTKRRELEEEFSDIAQTIEAEEVVWLPPRDSNPDMLIQRQGTLDFPLFLDVPGSLRNVMQSPFQLVC